MHEAAKEIMTNREHSLAEQKEAEKRTKYILRRQRQVNIKASTIAKLSTHNSIDLTAAIRRDIKLSISGGQVPESTRRSLPGIVAPLRTERPMYAAPPQLPKIKKITRRVSKPTATITPVATRMAVMSKRSTFYESLMGISPARINDIEF